MNETTTTCTGPLGSTIHVLRADADTIAVLAAVDWSRHFRRVCLDPVRGPVTLMLRLRPTRPAEPRVRVVRTPVPDTGAA